ncbi:hypothetical protein GobsT_60170 [Gemmata obscuriglobus]|uniref:Uncharacterized protein n=1 Tax=Gemmata obscuriglobus TaxID=114 RepID=A0A2Z3GS93_9BACT|nr:hypothetical protein [Gemmata obscuriglobus]AWM36208.1 hypothetical protein C1280_03730 [Gemmata obscuriglobus]QEG31196.1 hypothetical protein GobsT_60170 [Gemmata obscuriglobus]VTS10534.1 unnamed protein product [Gemmata obscuriglobus UQM 2246]
MTIDGVSQTTGLERLVDIGADEGGLKLTIRDRKLETVLGSVTVPAEDLMTVLTEQPKGPQNISGALEVEIRRNEVWLTLGGPDAAVGLDDLMDAVGGALPS